MTKVKKTMINTLWFAIVVTGVFVIIQVVRYAFGNWDAPDIGLFLIGITALLFIAAYLYTRLKDKRDIDKPSGKAITNILS